jgi:hypothetical protein
MDDVAVRYPTNVEDVARVLADLTSKYKMFGMVIARLDSR